MNAKYLQAQKRNTFLQFNIRILVNYLRVCAFGTIFIIYVYNFYVHDKEFYQKSSFDISLASIQNIISSICESLS